MFQFQSTFRVFFENHFFYHPFCKKDYQGIFYKLPLVGFEDKLNLDLNK